MTLAEWGAVVPLLSLIVTLSGAVIAAVWFVVQRQFARQIEFDVDAKITRVETAPVVAECVITLRNKGKVRIKTLPPSLKVRFFKTGDPVKKLDEARLKFLHPLFRLEKIIDYPYTFVEPGITQYYRLTFVVPDDALLLLLHSEFYYDSKNNHTAEKLVEVGRSSEGRLISVGTG